jgi:uncharacterized protein YehS (DUF1456 family)
VATLPVICSQTNGMALSNNDILKKLRVALALRDAEIVEILQLADFKTSKSELGAFFRNESHPKYMELQDQILRNFLNGLIIYKRGPLHKENLPQKKEPK